MEKSFFLKLNEDGDLQACQKQKTYDIKCRLIDEIDDLLDFIRN